MMTLTPYRTAPDTHRMTRPPQGINPEVAEIVDRVLGDLSLEQAAVHLRYALTRTPISDLKRGKVGRENTVRVFAEGLWQKFCELYGDEIAPNGGECGREVVSDWFAAKCGFRPRYAALLLGEDESQRPPRPELTYEADLEDFDVRAFRGADRIPENDIEIINSVMRDLIAQSRKRYGIE